MSSTAIRAGRAFVEIFADDSKLVRGLRGVQAKLKAFGAATQSLGTDLFKLGSVASAPFALATRTFATFESTMQRVKALASPTGAQFAALQEQAKKLGAETVYSASQASEAMSFFALAGFKVDQIMKAMTPTLNLAAAGQLDIAEAADISAKIMAGMGINADDLGGAVDILAKAMSTANTDLRQLGDAMKYIGPVAKNAGYSLEETVAAVQLLSNAGIQADMAGTTLRGAILSLTDPSVEAKELLDQLGVSVLDSHGNMRPLAGIIDDLNAALTGLGTGDKLGIIGRIFDARQAAGFAELMAQGGQRLRDATTALQSSTGTASRIAGTQLDAVKGDAIILTSALEGLGIAIGETFGAKLRTLITETTSVVNAIKAWTEANAATVTTIAAVSVATLGIGVVLGGLGATITFGAKALGLIAAGWAALHAPVGLAATALSKFGTLLAVEIIPSLLAAGSRIGDTIRAMTRMQMVAATLKTALAGALVVGVFTAFAAAAQAELQAVQQSVETMTAHSLEALRKLRDETASTIAAAQEKPPAQSLSELKAKRDQLTRDRKGAVDMGFLATQQFSEQANRSWIDKKVNGGDTSALHQADTKYYSDRIAEIDNSLAALDAAIKQQEAIAAQMQAPPPAAPASRPEPPETPEQRDERLAAEQAEAQRQTALDAFSTLQGIGNQALTNITAGRDVPQAGRVADRLGGDLRTAAEALRASGEEAAATEAEDRAAMFDDIAAQLAQGMELPDLARAAEAFNPDRLKVLEAALSGGNTGAAAALADSNASAADAAGNQMAAEYYTRRATEIRDGLAATDAVAPETPKTQQHEATFSSMASQMFAIGRGPERAAEETAENTRELLKIMRRGGVTQVTYG